MKKIIIIIALSLIVLVFGVAIWFWARMSQPLYEPGMVRAGENLRAPLTPPAQTGETGYWSVEPDIQLRHFSAGEGRNVLIIHGGPGYPPSEPWLGLEPLTSEYQFHYYDQRGCGQSTRPVDRFASNNYYENMTALDQALGLGAQIADIERIRQILGEEKLILVGHSFGGFIASLYAAEFPEYVEALVLIAPANILVMPQESDDLFSAVRSRLPEDMHAEYDAFMEDYLDYGNVFSKSDAEWVAVNNKFAEYYRAVVDIPVPQGGEPGGWMVQAMYLSMGIRHDYRDALESFSGPVLVVHGADDLQTEETSRIYMDAFPNARFQVIDNSGHFVYAEQPEAFAAAVGEFLSEVK